MEMQGLGEHEGAQGRPAPLFFFIFLVQKWGKRAACGAA